jgi:hypothetical protein
MPQDNLLLHGLGTTALYPATREHSRSQDTAASLFRIVICEDLVVRQM